MAWWIFQNVVTIAVLAAAVAIVCRYSRIGPVARHALWVLVLVKFITPPVVVWPWAAPDPLGLARLTTEARRDAPAPRTIAAKFVAAAGETDSAVLEAAPGVPGVPGVIDAAQPASSPSAVSPWTVLAFVWIAGSICVLGIEIVRLMRLARRVRRALPADPAIERRVAQLAKQLGVASVPVVSLQGSASPVVWCLGRPQLLWPAWLTYSLGSRTDAADSRTDSGLWTPDPGLTESCIDGLIVHELAHIKRRDHIVGWIELVAGVVWWWNPLFWSVRSALREQAELACDAWVISALPDGRRAYAESLLALSSPGSPALPSTAAVMGVRASSRRVLERRLVMIMKGRASLRLPWAGLLTLALLAAATLPAWATGTDADDQQAAQAAQAAQTKPAPQTAPPPQTKPAPATVPAKPTPKTMQHVIVPKQHVTVVPIVPTVKHNVVTPQAQGANKPRFSFFAEPSHLTEEGKKLVETLIADTEAIQKEADAKAAAKREAAVKALEALQDQYTKAGKLDEALAIRDYLRAGGPGGASRYSLFIRKR